jgi:hypothetical protein
MMTLFMPMHANARHKIFEKIFDRIFSPRCPTKKTIKNHAENFSSRIPFFNPEGLTQ